MAKPAPRQLEWVRPPRQERSHKTLERVLDAAEALVLEKGVDRLTVAEVARRAGSSVGAFYARFPDKEALVHTLCQRFHRQAVATADDVLAPARWRGVPIREVLSTTIAFLVRVARERGRLLAAFSRQTDPEIRALSRVLGEHVAERVNALARSRGDRFGHPDPEEGIRFCVWTVLGALQSRAVQLEMGDPPAVPDEVVASELGRMCLAYLQAD